MGFHAEQKPISKLLNDCVLAIPRNQRHYVWKEENWKDLLTDVFFIVDNKNDKNHFIGSIVLKEEEPINKLEKFTIIDGQQRTITIILFLSAIMKLFQDYGMDKDFYGTIPYLISKDRKDEEYCILYTEDHVFIQELVMKIVKYENKKSINELIKISSINKRKENNIIKAILYFYNELKKKCESVQEPNNYLISVRDALIDTNCVKIIADTEEDSYTIFEILNARGQVLADHELVKNYIMRYILPKNAVDTVKKKWEAIEDLLGTSINRFFKHYTTHKTQVTSKEAIYRILQKIYPKNEASNLMDDIMLKSKYYHAIISPEKRGSDANCSEIEYKVFHFFKEKRAEQFRPILLSLMSKKEEGLLSIEKYEKVLEFLYAFFICYNIVGEEKSNKLEDVIYKYAPMLENNFNNENLETFINSIKNKIPSLKIFGERLQTLGWSNHNKFYNDKKNKDRVRIVLELVEKHLSGRINFEDLSLEHVLPDSQDSENALIGNIILLEDNINQNCKNKAFKDKLDFYKKSNYKMAREFANRYENDDFVPQKRARFLAKMIYDDILHLNQIE
ncbi:DUF262 domain-containing protein [uncultured Prevotella sp.]|uniref:DUF262 domain-containing protein n=1 Tax=uncultured Prevotella sp. TaxID=159272 RepID=UPI00265CA0F7|nr:DUF262 domain-containing protein [uncultured Prevotella sp.]